MALDKPKLCRSTYTYRGVNDMIRTYTYTTYATYTTYTHANTHAC